MICKTIRIGEKDIRIRASATIPRLYRAKFRRDIFKDLMKLSQSFEEIKEGEEERDFSIDDLEVFENVAYIMAYHADNNIEKTPEEWLDNFDGVLDIYEALPEILELWGMNVETEVKSKKNLRKATGK